MRQMVLYSFCCFWRCHKDGVAIIELLRFSKNLNMPIDAMFRRPIRVVK